MKMFITHQVNGHKRGSKMGVPTINLLVPSDFGYEYGIYAGKIGLVETTTHKKTWYPAAIHFGMKPTFDEDDVTLEVNIIDTEPQNIVAYNPKSIEIALQSRIREVLKFETTEALIAQIKLDISVIRSRLQDTE